MDSDAQVIIHGCLAGCGAHLGLLKYRQWTLQNIAGFEIFCIRVCMCMHVCVRGHVVAAARWRARGFGMQAAMQIAKEGNDYLITDVINLLSLASFDLNSIRSLSIVSTVRTEASSPSAHTASIHGLQAGSGLLCPVCVCMCVCCCCWRLDHGPRERVSVLM